VDLPRQETPAQLWVALRTQFYLVARKREPKQRWPELRQYSAISIQKFIRRAILFWEAPCAGLDGTHPPGPVLHLLETESAMDDTVPAVTLLVLEGRFEEALDHLRRRHPKNGVPLPPTVRLVFADLLEWTGRPGESRELFAAIRHSSQLTELDQIRCSLLEGPTSSTEHQEEPVSLRRLQVRDRSARHD